MASVLWYLGYYRNETAESNEAKQCQVHIDYETRKTITLFYHVISYGRVLILVVDFLLMVGIKEKRKVFVCLSCIIFCECTIFNEHISTNPMNQ